jgi:imidazolonepropionase-like amidohydrolase
LLREEGRLGELIPGAWADVLLVDGDPTRELSMLTKPNTGIAVIVQAGRVVKNALAA